MFVLALLSEIIAAFIILRWLWNNCAFVLGNMLQAASAKENLLDDIEERLQYVQEHNLKLANAVDTEIGLYEVTKELSQSLEEQDVLSAFKEKVSAIFNLTGCSFIKSPLLENKSSEYSLFKISASSAGAQYFAVSDFGKINRAKTLVLLGELELFLKRARLYKEIQELSITDSLTGVYVRRYFLERFTEELSRAKQSGFALTFLILDVDNFKSINDTYGHLAGDAALLGIAGILQSSLRSIDMCARFGGEEFCLMLPETIKEQAFSAAQRLRLKVQEARLKAFNETLACTVSIGIASYPDDADQVNALIDKADKALYKAKAQGRNRVCAAGMK